MTVLAHDISSAVSRFKLAKTNSWLPKRKDPRKNEVILYQNIKLNAEKKDSIDTSNSCPPN
jgi:hypothetical protein